MWKHLKSPWMLSLLISLLTVVFVRFQLAACMQYIKDTVEPKAKDQSDEPDVAPQPEPEPEAAPQPPQPKLASIQRNEPQWQPGMPPPMPVTMAFTEVSEVEQDPLGDDAGAFENTE